MIFYGLNGEGLGHSMRAQSVMSMFPNEEFIIFSYKDGYSYFSGGNVQEIKGFSFKYKNGAVCGISGPFPSTNLNQDIYERFKKPKLCITDWEPTISRYAKRAGLPCVSIDNQHKFKFGDAKGLSLANRMNALAASLVCSVMVPYATDYVVVTFSEVKSEKCTWVPIIPPKDVQLTRSNIIQDFNLVYCKPETFGKISTKLPKGERFKIFCKEKIDWPNSTCHAISRENFLEELSHCKKLYCNAGNTILSEALYLNVPVDITPIDKHFEQSYNFFSYQNLQNEVYDGSDKLKSVIEKYL